MRHDDPHLPDLLSAACKAVRCARDLDHEWFVPSDLNHTSIFRILDILREAGPRTSEDTNDAPSALRRAETVGIRNRTAPVGSEIGPERIGSLARYARPETG